MRSSIFVITGIAISVAAVSTISGSTAKIQQVPATANIGVPANSDRASTPAARPFTLAEMNKHLDNRLTVHPVIQVVSGTYGGNCGRSEGNVTGYLARACNDKLSCKYSVDYKVIGDPAPGCAKDYVAKWTCSGSGEQTARAEPEAGYGSAISLTCQ